jgi:opacity protein-like surface antigen
MYRTTATVSYGLFDGLNVYLKIGTSQQQIRGSFTGSGTVVAGGGPLATTIYNGLLKYSTDNAFAYGGGVKLTQDLNDCWIMGCLGQYLREENDYKASRQYTQDITAAGTFLAFEGWHGELTTQNWLIAPYLAKKINNLTPYFGAAYTILRMKDKSELPTSISTSASNATSATDLSVEGYVLNFRNRRSISPFVGMDIKFDDHWKINAEGRFVDETAVSLSGSYMF